MRWRDTETLPKTQVASLLGVSRSTLNRIVRRGEIETATVGGRQLVRTASLRRYLGEDVDEPPRAGALELRISGEILERLEKKAG